MTTNNKFKYQPPQTYRTMDLLPLKDIEYQNDCIIKVVGVGGGGCNAVNYMFHQNIQDVSFLVCNTDRQALLKMDVPSKLQLGDKGLGAGGEPERARQFAIDSTDRIKEALNDGTQMVFITAGMGGGTGTGAAPVIAKIAKDMDILTVGIVTIPFAFEGIQQIRKAMIGLSKLAINTDAILVINNEKLKQIYPDFDLPNAFNKSDEVVSNAAKAISEIITIPGYINTDFADVKNILKGGNMAIMNVGEAEGEQRITKAIEDALHSPLVNTNDVKGASRILINFYCSHDNAILMQELDQVDQFRKEVGNDVMVKWGATYDDTLGDKVKVTLIATGYPFSDIPGLDEVTRQEETEQEQPEDKEPVAIQTPTIDGAIEKLYSGNAPVPMEITNENAEGQDKDGNADEKTQQEVTESENENENGAVSGDEEAKEPEAEKASEQQSATQDSADGDTFDLNDDDDNKTIPSGNLQKQKTDIPRDTVLTISPSDQDVILIDDLSDSNLADLEDIPTWKRKK